MLFVAQTAEPVASALGTPGGPVAVIGDVRLARALRERGFDVIALGTSFRALGRSAGARVCAADAALPFADGALAAVVGLGIAEQDSWQPRLAAWSRPVRDGGQVILVDKAEPTELSRRALCGGLSAIEQRFAGRSCITSGRVQRWSLSG